MAVEGTTFLHRDDAWTSKYDGEAKKRMRMLDRCQLCEITIAPRIGTLSNTLTTLSICQQHVT